MAEGKNKIDNPLEKCEIVHADEFLTEDNWFNVDVEKDFLDFEEPYQPPRYTLSRKGVPFANVGELHVISGKPGHGKTGLMSMFMAAILSGKNGNTEYVLQREKPNPVVLYIDTEMGKDDTIAIKNRVCTMAGMDIRKPCDRFKILRLRDTESADDRWRKILKAIYIVKPTDIFLDGFLDIVKDYNDQVECQPIVRKTMMLATHYDTSMWLVLHENPMMDKMVGTLGSITQRKVTEILSVRKVKQCDLKEGDRNPEMPSIYFLVKQLKARGKDLEDWTYAYTQDAGWGTIVEHETPEAPAAPIDAKKETTAPTKEFCHEKLLAVAPIDHIGFTALRERLKAEHSIGSTQARDIIQYSIKYGILEQHGEKYWMDTDSIRFEDEQQESNKDPF